MDITTIVVYLGIAVAISEALSVIPGVQANGIFQLCYKILKAVYNGIKNKEV